MPSFAPFAILLLFAPDPTGRRMGQSWKQQGWHKADSYSFTGQHWKGSALRRPASFPAHSSDHFPESILPFPYYQGLGPSPTRIPAYLSNPSPPPELPWDEDFGPRSSSEHPRGGHRAHREGCPEPEPHSNEERCRLANGGGRG